MNLLSSPAHGMPGAAGTFGKTETKRNWTLVPGFQLHWVQGTSERKECSVGK